MLSTKDGKLLCRTSSHDHTRLEYYVELSKEEHTINQYVESKYSGKAYEETNKFDCRVSLPLA